MRIIAKPVFCLICVFCIWSVGCGKQEKPGWQKALEERKVVPLRDGHETPIGSANHQRPSGSQKAAEFKVPPPPKLTPMKTSPDPKADSKGDASSGDRPKLGPPK